MNVVKEGEGQIEKRDEAVSKKNEKYIRFTINGKIYSLFEFDKGNGIVEGDSVTMKWSESEGTYNGKPITYRNLFSITKVTGTNQVKQDVPSQSQVKITDGPAYKPSSTDADKFELGMAKNNAAALVVAIINKADSVDEAKELLKENGEYYDQLVESLYNRGREIRKKLLGY